MVLSNVWLAEIRRPKALLKTSCDHLHRQRVEREILEVSPVGRARVGGVVESVELDSWKWILEARSIKTCTELNRIFRPWIRHIVDGSNALACVAFLMLQDCCHHPQRRWPSHVYRDSAEHYFGMQTGDWTISIGYLATTMRQNFDLWNANFQMRPSRTQPGGVGSVRAKWFKRFSERRVVPFLFLLSSWS